MSLLHFAESSRRQFLSPSDAHQFLGGSAQLRKRAAKLRGQGADISDGWQEMIMLGKKVRLSKVVANGIMHYISKVTSHCLKLYCQFAWPGSSLSRYLAWLARWDHVEKNRYMFSKVLSNRKRCYICKVFSHCIKPYSVGFKMVYWQYVRDHALKSCVLTRPKPMRKYVTYVTSSHIGQNLAEISRTARDNQLKEIRPNLQGGSEWEKTIHM